uniref:DUF2927 domain-containing protein n=1 Tax=Rhodopseudomonas palustris (strain BisA53) TaxID=316055 RepID=Q07IK8_RHOP5
MRRHPALLRPIAAALAALIGSAAICAAPAHAEPVAIAAKRRTEQKLFTDAEIVDGFFKVAFGAEYHLAGRVDRIRKYSGPVRVFAQGARRDRKAQIAGIVADIGAKVQHLDIAMASSAESANVIISLVRDRDLARTLTASYGAERAKEIRASLDPQCLSGFRKNEAYEIEHSDVILTIDNGDLVFLDCAYEELLQSLGPINDTDKVPWTMFNDDVQMGFFGVYDQYLLNILYHPLVRPGMTVPEVKEVLPQVLGEVRSFVSRINKLPN